MLMSLYIYLGIGVLYAWATVEVGNREAKQKGLTFRQYVAEQTKEVDPRVQQFLSSMRILVICMIIGWLPGLIAAIHIAKKK